MWGAPVAQDLGDERGLRTGLLSKASLRLRLWGSRFSVFMYSFSFVVSPCMHEDDHSAHASALFRQMHDPHQPHAANDNAWVAPILSGIFLTH